MKYLEESAPSRARVPCAYPVSLDTPNRDPISKARGIIRAPQDARRLYLQNVKLGCVDVNLFKSGAMSKTHRLLVLLGVFLLAGIAPRLAAQPVSSVTLSGTVVEAETGQPLEGANVFLANTLIGTTTDQNGFFSMTGVTLGTHELVASFVGFQAQTERLRLTQAGDLTVDFRLALRVVESDGIEVTATSPKRWQRQYKTFEKFFLGISRNASKCEILNPEVLDFEVDEATGAFIARARSPLLIENRALGYLLRFVLEGFQLNEKKRLIRYRGRVGFTEIRPRSDREAQRWARRRLEAYNGSFRHFLASLVRDELAREGVCSRVH